MKTRPGEKIKMLTVDELLGVPEGESAVQIEVNKIYALSNYLKYKKYDKFCQTKSKICHILVVLIII